MSNHKLFNEKLSPSQKRLFNLYRPFENYLPFRFLYLCFISFFYDKETRNQAFSKTFFAENKDRVRAVVNVLADQKSKKTYLSMIKFRQETHIKNFPLFQFVSHRKLYFFKDFKFDKDEVFINCGASDWDIKKFIKRCPEYRQIIAFQPLTTVYEGLRNDFKDDHKITTFNACVYDTEGDIPFFEAGSSSKVSVPNDTEKTTNTTTKPSKTIDGLGLERVSYIKMDIEGSELNALKGAEKTLLRDKPKLAICLYHSDEDMISIIEYLHSLVPEYRLYVRQHCSINTDTVLYALSP